MTLNKIVLSRANAMESSRANWTKSIRYMIVFDTPEGKRTLWTSTAVLGSK